MWGLFVAAYLFFGGLSAGMFVATALLQLAHGNRFLRVVRAGSTLSLAFLLVGLGLLLADVAVPLRALDMASSFQNVGASWMARGAWILAACSVLFLAYALVALVPRKSRMALRYRAPLLNALGLAGMTAALALAWYTGMLLGDAAGIPAWGTWFVPVLFALSALDTGLALSAALFASIERVQPYWESVLRRFDLALAALLVGELAVLGLYVAFLVEGSLTGEAFQRALATTPAGLQLAGVCVALVLALAMCAAGLARRRSHIPVIWGAAVCSLAGGFLLRMAVLALGVHGSFGPPLLF